jgi:hypothetical protein
MLEHGTVLVDGNRIKLSTTKSGAGKADIDRRFRKIYRK